MDVVGDGALYGRVHERLIGGYVQDALRVRGVEGDPDPEAAEAFLAGVRTASRVDSPTVGRGVYRVLHGSVTGGELEDAGRTVHLSAFPARDESGRAGSGASRSPLAPPSHRRRIR
ncbi:MAG TPA: DUF6569 family protein [Gemmatimonadota bacterium]